MGRALQGFGQEQGKGGGQLSAVEAPAPKQVCSPVALGLATLGQRWALLAGSLLVAPAMDSFILVYGQCPLEGHVHTRDCICAPWRVACLHTLDCIYASWGLFAPLCFSARVWVSSCLDALPWVCCLALWPVLWHVCPL